MLSPTVWLLFKLKVNKVAQVFTIGYGNRSIDDFMEIIRRTGVKYLLDVRSTPYSRYSPAFNRETLEATCSEASVKYLFMGDKLGGKPQSDRCYDIEGRVDYNILQEEEYFVAGLSRVENAVAQNIDVVLMCSELRPEQCHRSKLIGRALEKRGISLHHFDADESIVEQSDVIARLRSGQPSIFGKDAEVFTSRAKRSKELIT